MSRMRPCLAFLGVLTLALASCQSAPLPESVVENPPDPFEAEPVPYVLGPGDLVQVRIFGQPTLSTPESGQRLDFQGRLSLPMLAPITLVGLELDAARERVTESLKRYLVDPQVNMQVLEYASRVCFVYGEVENPGPVVLGRPHTALTALSMAGTPTIDADLEQVCVLRGRRDELAVYYFNAETPGPDGMFLVQPNDFIFVRKHGAGTFRSQILPVVQTLVPPVATLASLIIAANSFE